MAAYDDSRLVRAASPGEVPEAAATSQAATGGEESPFVLERRRMVLHALTKWSTDALIGEKWRAQIKADMRAAISLASDEIEQLLCKLLDHQTAMRLMPRIRGALDIFNGLSTPRTEATQLVQLFPSLKTYERVVGPLATDVAYVTELAEWLQMKMAHDARFATAEPRT